MGASTGEAKAPAQEGRGETRGQGKEGEGSTQQGCDSQGAKNMRWEMQTGHNSWRDMRAPVCVVGWRCGKERDRWSRAFTTKGRSPYFTL